MAPSMSFTTTRRQRKRCACGEKKKKAREEEVLVEVSATRRRWSHTPHGCTRQCPPHTCHIAHPLTPCTHASIPTDLLPWPRGPGASFGWRIAGASPSLSKHAHTLLLLLLCPPPPSPPATGRGGGLSAPLATPCPPSSLLLLLFLLPSRLHLPSPSSRQPTRRRRRRRRRPRLDGSVQYGPRHARRHAHRQVRTSTLPPTHVPTYLYPPTHPSTSPVPSWSWRCCLTCASRQNSPSSGPAPTSRCCGKSSWTPPRIPSASQSPSWATAGSDAWTRPVRLSSSHPPTPFLYPPTHPNKTVLLHSLTAPNQLPALRMSAKEINADPARLFGGKGGWVGG